MNSDTLEMFFNLNFQERGTKTNWNLIYLVIYFIVIYKQVHITLINK